VNHEAERTAFLRAILDQPADDTARLVFADWLDENGDATDRARARFIRHQIAEAVHNRDVFYPLAQAMIAEWDAGPGKGKDGPVEVDPNSPAGKPYFEAFKRSLLMQTQTRLMLEKHAEAWLDDLPAAVLDIAYYRRGQVVERPDVIVLRDHWRDWIEFKTGELRSGPLSHFRRGFVDRVQYEHFFAPGEERELREVFLQQPVEGVRSNRVPDFERIYPAAGWDGSTESASYESRLRWWWLRGNRVQRDLDSTSDIYPAVFDRLPNSGATRGFYPSRESAVADFQWACASLGRELAGLPMLPKPPVPELPDPKKMAAPRKEVR
jgi:uncharacterized protein (TIGR02996 family)